MKQWKMFRSVQAIRNDLNRPVLRAEFDKVRELAGYWMDNFEDSVDSVAGWAHDSVCPRCAARLIYDREKPLEHCCPVCGVQTENTPLITQAWVYMRRNDIADGIKAAAMVAVIDANDKAAEFVRKAIGWYAENYTDFEVHGKHAGKGKVMEQSLDEAVWCVDLLLALFFIGFDGTSKEGRKLYQQLFLPLSQSVLSQSRGIHNISLWHTACATGSAILFEDEDLLEKALDGPFGGRLQILEGFAEDGIWYENSTNYHYYALEAATCLYRFLHTGCRTEPELAARILKGWTAFSLVAYRDGTLPAINDGWKAQSLSLRCNQEIEAAWIFREQPGLDALNSLVNNLEDRESSLSALLYGIPDASSSFTRPRSVLLAHNKIGMLRSESGNFEVFCKFGNLARTHAHPDALSISIYPFSVDTGTTGYGSRLYGEWYTRTAAHSTFAIDAQDQNCYTCGTGCLSSDGNKLTMNIADAYPGVSARRTLRLMGDVLEDIVTIQSETTHVIDWFFHGTGEFCVNGERTPTKIPEKDSGYAWLSPIEEWRGDHFEAQWMLGGETLTLSFDFAQMKGARIYVARSPDNPGNLYRHTVLIRKTASQFEIPVRFERTGMK